MGLLASDDGFVDEREMDEEAVADLYDEGDYTVADFGPEAWATVGVLVVAAG